MKLWRIVATPEGVMPTETAALKAHRFPINCLAFSPDGSMLVSAGGRGRGDSERLRVGEVFFWYGGDGAEPAIRSLPSR